MCFFGGYIFSLVFDYCLNYFQDHKHSLVCQSSAEISLQQIWSVFPSDPMLLKPAVPSFLKSLRIDWIFFKISYTFRVNLWCWDCQEESRILKVSEDFAWFMLCFLKKKKKNTTERLEEFTGVTIYKLLLDWQYRQSKVIRDGYW